MLSNARAIALQLTVSFPLCWVCFYLAWRSDCGNFECPNLMWHSYTTFNRVKSALCRNVFVDVIFEILSLLP